MRDYSFGNFLHELRSRRGLTQYQLGALVGVSDKAVSKWENGSSKPQSGILYKLSEVLGISVDELLTCKYHSFGKKDVKGVFAMKKQLWKKVFDAMHKRYSDPIPLEIANRFWSEQAEMQSTDMIVYLDMLATLAAKAKQQNGHLRVKGGTGASFVSFLLGTTEVNPLRPHYYCPVCHALVFSDNTDDGWDLPAKQCSCGKAMLSDGHNIPFETYRHAIHGNASFDISVSPNFFEKAKKDIKSYFKDCDLTLLERDEGRIVTFSVASCSITLCADEESARYQALETATATSFTRVPFSDNDVLREFQSGHTDGIPEFCPSFMKDLLSKMQPTSFHDLIQILGLSHGADKVISYRDDVFNYIQERMTDKSLANTGFAYQVMENTRRGVYSKNGVSDELKEQLKRIGLGDWFTDSIGKIRYLFPKAHGVSCMQLAATLMWYKIHFPKEFKEIML